MLATRLLELEQKFESYRTIHEEELREIKATLDQLREDILRNDPDHITVAIPKAPMSVSVPEARGGKSGRKA